MTKHGLTDEQISGWWDIARVGSWQGSQAGKPVKIEISQEDLEQMVEDYDPDCQLNPEENSS